MELKQIIECFLFTAAKPMNAQELASLVRKAERGEKAEKGKKAKDSEKEPEVEPETEPEAESAEEVVEDEGKPDFARVKVEAIEAALEELKPELEGRPYFLQEVGGGYRLATRPEYERWLTVLSPEARPTKLSQPGLETLAVIAYRQPISRAEIEAVRGVAVGGVLETLVEKGIIRVAGRAEVPGRPLLYETTPSFLEHFGLGDLRELPNVDELKRAKLPEAEDDDAQPELIHEPEGTESTDRQD